MQFLLILTKRVTLTPNIENVDQVTILFSIISRTKRHKAPTCIPQTKRRRLQLSDGEQNDKKIKESQACEKKPNPILFILCSVPWRSGARSRSLTCPENVKNYEQRFFVHT